MWVTYHLLSRSVAGGQHAEPMRQMRSLARQKPNDPERNAANMEAFIFPAASGPSGAGASQYPADQPVERNIQELAGRLQK